MTDKLNAQSGGQAAGRDIHNLNLHLGSPKPESQRQAEFAQRTGIWCPKPAREWLEDLMENHRFTAHELVASWKAGSIGWNADKDTKRVITPWIETLFAYGMIGFLGVYFLAVAGHLILGNSTDNQWGVAAFCGIGAMYLGMCWMANRFILWPRRVALRIKCLYGDGLNESDLGNAAGAMK